jgi:tetratricopeptide (TPR) repeat protein
MAAPIQIFCCYAHVDRDSYRELERHASALVRARKIELSGVESPPPGADWRREIEESLSRADVILFLTSADMLSEDRCWAIVESAKELERERGVNFLVILLREVDLTDTQLEGRRSFPRSPHPTIAACSNRDAAWKQIVEEFRLLLVQKRHQSGRNFIERGKLDAASSDLDAARIELDRIIEQDPGNRERKKERAKLGDRLGRASYAKGAFEDARVQFERSLEYRRELLAREPADQELLLDLSASCYWLGHLAFVKGDLAVAHREQEEGRRICEQLLVRSPNDLGVLRDIVVLRTDLGTTLEERGDLDAATALLRLALATARRLAGEHPQNLQSRRDLSVCLFRLARVLLACGNDEEALVCARESVGLCQELTQREPEKVHWRRHEASARFQMGEVHASAGDLEAAASEYQAALNILDAVIAAGSPNAQYLHERAAPLCGLAELSLRQRKKQETLDGYERAIGSVEAALAVANNPRWKMDLLQIHLAVIGAHELAPVAGALARAMAIAKELARGGAHS